MCVWGGVIFSNPRHSVPHIARSSIIGSILDSTMKKNSCFTQQNQYSFSTTEKFKYFLYVLFQRSSLQPCKGDRYNYLPIVHGAEASRTPIRPRLNCELIDSLRIEEGTRGAYMDVPETKIYLQKYLFQCFLCIFWLPKSIWDFLGRTKNPEK